MNAFTMLKTPLLVVVVFALISLNRSQTVGAPAEEELQCYAVCVGGHPILHDPPTITPNYETSAEPNPDGQLERHVTLEGHLPYPDDNIYLDVVWYTDDVILLTEDALPYTQLPTILHQDVWQKEHNLTLPLTAKLNMTAKYSSLPGEESNVVTAVYFMGFQIEPETLEIQTGEIAEVHLHPTIPILCPVDSEGGASASGDSLHIHTYQLPEEDGKDVCSPPLTYLKVLTERDADGQHTCTVKVPQTASTNDTITMYITGTLNNLYDPQRNLQLVLEVDGEQCASAWDGYKETIEVQLQDTEHLLEHSICSQFCDPHTQTFDGRTYQMMFTGGLLIYKHDVLPIEVHGYYKDAGYVEDLGSNWSTICAILIRSGGDLFIHDRCHPHADKKFKRLRVGVFQCDDEKMVVEHLENVNYRVTLPTGMVVLVGNQNFQILPSALDIGQISGLCGFLDFSCANEYKLRNGTIAYDEKGDKCDRFNCEAQKWRGCEAVWPDDFIQDWRLTPEEETMYLGVIPDDRLFSGGAYPQGDEYCGCTEDGSMQCGIFQACTDSTELGKEMRQCIEAKNARKRRSADGGGSDDVQEVEGVFEHSIDSALKDRNWKNSWTAESAREVCTQSLVNEADLEGCYNYSLVDPEMHLSECIEDIRIDGTTNYIVFHLNGVIELCREQALKRVDLYEPGPDGQLQPPSEIFDTLCPGQCSGRGSCIQGTCICPPTHEGRDCGLAVDRVPTLDSEEVQYCDRSTRPCARAQILGDNFRSSSQLMCLVTKQKVLMSGETKNVSSGVITTAEYGHDSRVLCDLTPDDSTFISASLDGDWFTTAYSIAVTNDGSRYSNEMQVYIVDSDCMACDTQGECVAKPGTCVSKGVCQTGCSNGDGMNVGVVITAAAAAAVSLVVLGITVRLIYNRQKRRVQSNTETEQTAGADSSDMKKTLGTSGWVGRTPEKPPGPPAYPGSNKRMRQLANHS